MNKNKTAMPESPSSGRRGMKASVATKEGLSSQRSRNADNWGGQYFTLSELTHSDTAVSLGIDNTPGPVAQNSLTLLVDRVLDPLREAWGSPIIVTSGYRCEELNKRVGGVKTSYHLRGMAADIRPKNGFLYELYSFVERMFVDNKMPITECYIDHRKGYIHIAYDVEDSNKWPFIN